MSGFHIAQPEQLQRLEWIGGSRMTMLLDGAATNDQLMMSRIAAERGEAPPYHKHLYEDEMFVLLRGTALVWCDEEEHELAEGGVVFLPRDVPHSYRVTSAHADILVVNTPAGVEGMFREVGHDLGEPKPAGRQVQPNPEVSERYGNIILGPPR